MAAGETWNNEMSESFSQMLRNPGIYYNKFILHTKLYILRAIVLGIFLSIPLHPHIFSSSPFFTSFRIFFLSSSGCLGSSPSSPPTATVIKIAPAIGGEARQRDRFWSLLCYASGTFSEPLASNLAVQPSASAFVCRPDSCSGEVRRAFVPREDMLCTFRALWQCLQPNTCLFPVRFYWLFKSSIYDRHSMIDCI